MAKTVIIVFMLLLMCCNKRQYPDEISESIDQVLALGKITVAEKAQSMHVEKDLTQRLKLGEITIAEIIVQELKSAAAIYEILFKRSVLVCEKCTELELLLILERANSWQWLGIYDERNIVPYVDVPYITKNRLLENELAGAGSEYEKKFGKKLPWWWICQDKEKLERIKRAFETNTPYPEYSGSRGEIDYRLGKAIAEYEMWFKRPPPEQNRLDEEWLVRLKSAVRTESPLLTTGEEATLKTEYFKKVKKPITDFESSIVKVSLARMVSEKSNPQMSVVRTAAGATAIYQPFAGYQDITSINPGSIEMKLDFGEWLNFANTVHKYVDYRVEPNCKEPKGEFGPDDYWVLRLFFANTDTIVSRVITSVDECSPIDWKSIIKFMKGMGTKTKNKGVKKQSKTTSVEQKRVRLKGDMSNRPEILKITKGPLSVNQDFIVGVKSDGTIVATIGRPHLWLVRFFSNLNTWDNIVAVSNGYYDIVGLKSNNTVITTNKRDQRNVSNWKDIVAVSAGRHHTLGLRSAGTVMATGLNYDGQCNVTGWNNIVAISAGGFHTLGLRSDGTVVSAGSNSSNQCDVDDWNDIVAISAGRYHSVGLKSDGTAVAVGRDWDGMCSKTRRWNNIIAVAAGDFHTAGLKSDGTVVAVGDNTDGQCDVPGWSNIIAIAACAGRTVGLKSDGTAVAVGEIPAEAVSGWSGLAVGGVEGSR